MNKTYVAYETLYCEGRLLAAHADLDDLDQTIYVPEIGTVATANDTGRPRPAVVGIVIAALGLFVMIVRIRKAHVARK